MDGQDVCPIRGIGHRLGRGSIARSEHRTEGIRLWVWIWILTAGAAGIVGGAIYLVSLDGPMRYAPRGLAVSGWVLMLFSAALPSPLTLMTIPLVVTLIPGLFKGPWNEAGTAPKSHSRDVPAAPNADRTSVRGP